MGHKYTANEKQGELYILKPCFFGHRFKILKYARTEGNFVVKAFSKLAYNINLLALRIITFFKFAERSATKNIELINKTVHNFKERGEKTPELVDIAAATLGFTSTKAAKEAKEDELKVFELKNLHPRLAYIVHRIFKNHDNPAERLVELEAGIAAKL